MPRLPNADEFPSFTEVKPSEEGFTCIWYLTNQGRRCSRKINPKDRSAAASAHRAILETPQGGSLAEKSMLLVELTCCKKNHRKKLRESDVGVSIQSKWCREVRPASPVPGDLQSSASFLECNPPTETPSVCCVQPSEQTPKHVLRSRTVWGGLSCRETVESESLRQTPHFVPRTSASQLTFAELLLQPLKSPKAKKPQRNSATPPWQKRGSIYCFRRESDPGMLKIGRTGGSIDHRLDRWEKGCCYKPLLTFAAEDVPHVQRAEMLVHYELLQYWRKETKCRHNPDCPRKHQEWFEVNVDTARKTITNLATWLRCGHPYDDEGFLVDRWRNAIYHMEREGVEVTSQGLVDALHDLESEAKQTECRLSSPGDIQKGSSPDQETLTITFPADKQGVADALGSIIKIMASMGTNLAAQPSYRPRSNLSCASAVRHTFANAHLKALPVA
ncbi:hypothetical protein RBB50_007530 [Rhinocladiella similis]